MSQDRAYPHRIRYEYDQDPQSRLHQHRGTQHAQLRLVVDQQDRPRPPPPRIVLRRILAVQVAHLFARL